MFITSPVYLLCEFSPTHPSSTSTLPTLYPDTTPPPGLAPLPLINELALSEDAQGQGLAPTLAHSSKTTSRSRGTATARSSAGGPSVGGGGGGGGMTHGTTPTNVHSHNKKSMQQVPHEEARWKFENSKEARLMTVAPLALLAHHSTASGSSSSSRRGEKEKEKEGWKGEVLVKDNATGQGLGAGLETEDKGNDDGQNVVAVVTGDSITTAVLESGTSQDQDQGKGQDQGKDQGKGKDQSQGKVPSQSMKDDDDDSSVAGRTGAILSDSPPLLAFAILPLTYAILNLPNSIPPLICLSVR